MMLQMKNSMLSKNRHQNKINSTIKMFKTFKNRNILNDFVKISS